MNNILRKLTALLCVVAFALPTGWCCASVDKDTASVVHAASVAAAQPDCCHHKTKSEPAPSTRVPTQDGSCCGCNCSERSTTLSDDTQLKLRSLQAWIVVPVLALDLPSMLVSTESFALHDVAPPHCSLQAMYCVWRC